MSTTGSGSRCSFRKTRFSEHLPPPDRPVAEIKTADIDDFVADSKRPRVVNGLESRRLTPVSINRTLGLLRHMLNWAVGREYLVDHRSAAALKC